MVIHLSQRFSSMLCLFLFLQFFVISFRYDFHVDAVRMIVKARYRRRWLKKVRHDTSSVGKNCQYLKVTVN